MKNLFIYLIKFYKKNIFSPMKKYEMSPIFPSGSDYGLEAVQKYGAVREGCFAFLGELKM